MTHSKQYHLLSRIHLLVNKFTFFPTFIKFLIAFYRCCCGQARITHTVVPGIDVGSPGDIWLPHKHTRAHPTDAYGTIEFQGGAHPTKAQVNNLFLKLTSYHCHF